MRLILEITLVVAILSAFCVRDQVETSTERRQWTVINNLVTNQTRMILLLERKPQVILVPENQPTAAPSALKVAISE